MQSPEMVTDNEEVGLAFLRLVGRGVGMSLTMGGDTYPDRNLTDPLMV